MEIIDGIKVFSNPTTFFKWLWDYDKDTILKDNGDLYCEKELIAKLRFIRKRRGNGGRN